MRKRERRVARAVAKGDTPAHRKMANSSRTLGLGQPVRWHARSLTAAESESERQAAVLATVTSQRDDALRTLRSRANLVQTVEKVDQLVLSLERAVTRLGEGVDLMARLLGLVQTVSSGSFEKGKSFTTQKVRRP